MLSFLFYVTAKISVAEVGRRIEAMEAQVTVSGDEENRGGAYFPDNPKNYSLPKSRKVPKRETRVAKEQDLSGEQQAEQSREINTSAVSLVMEVQNVF